MAADPGRTDGPDVLDRPIDWERAERSPEFRELISAKRRFVVPATIFFLAWYLGFILLAGYATDFMGESVYEGLTVGYCLALTQFVMVFVLGLWYLRKADNEFDPLAEKAIAAYADDELHPASGRRFERERVGAEPVPEVRP
jgi:uncharacterized membrane protein (DUF485 family)